jgi:hypothetical protein
MNGLPNLYRLLHPVQVQHRENIIFEMMQNTRDLSIITNIHTEKDLRQLQELHLL